MVVLASTVICVGLSVAYVRTATPIYKSQAQLFVATSPALSQSTAALEQGGQFTEGRVLSYVDLATSPIVTRRVIRDLGLHMTGRTLAGKISASVPTGTVLINVTAADTSPQRARSIAAAVSTELISLIKTLERPSHGPSPVSVNVSSPAQLPTSPSSPRKSVDVALGVIVGLVVGLLLALAFERADKSVRNVDELTENLTVPVLAVIPVSSQSRKDIGSNPTAATLRHEALRNLRTSLSFIDVDSPPTSLVITSAVPNEGKSTVALTLAEVVAVVGQSVILVDGDLRRPAIARYSGVSTNVGLTDVLVDDSLLDEALVPHPLIPSLQVLQAGSPVPNPTDMLASHRMVELLDRLCSRASLVIVDTPPLGLVTDAALLAPHTSGAIVVVQPGLVPRRALQDCLAQLDLVNARVFGVVANKVRRDTGRYGYGYGYVADSETPASSRRSKSTAA